jgi:methylthioribose-1-phosphate isomerase
MPADPAPDRHRLRRPIWPAPDGRTVQVIDQRRLPHETAIVELATVDAVIHAIRSLTVRGAPLIGVSGAWGMWLAAQAAVDGGHGIAYIEAEARRLSAARPTAVNLGWAVDRVLEAIRRSGRVAEATGIARREAEALADAEAENCRRIGRHGLPLIEAVARERRPVRILTHCNAGWLACVEHGTATAPIYAAAVAGIPVHVWVDETRPLNQGARLTAWELEQAGVPHTVVADNAGGHLMQHGLVDLVIVGADRVTAAGDAANKIGTYLKALAARDTGVPFYVALPSSTFDWRITDGLREIPIEERDPDEVRFVDGWDGAAVRRVRVTPAGSPAANYAFDVTPARLITGLITERGVCRADVDDIRRLFPESTGEPRCSSEP